MAAKIPVHWSRYFTGNQVFHHRTDLRALVTVVDVDACLAESHQRSHTDTADDQRIDLIIGQQVRRHHAAVLNVAMVGENRRSIKNLTALVVLQGR